MRLDASRASSRAKRKNSSFNPYCDATSEGRLAYVQCAVHCNPLSSSELDDSPRPVSRNDHRCRITTQIAANHSNFQAPHCSTGRSIARSLPYQLNQRRISPFIPKACESVKLRRIACPAAVFNVKSHVACDLVLPEEKRLMRAACVPPHFLNRRRLLRCRYGTASQIVNLAGKANPDGPSGLRILATCADDDGSSETASHVDRAGRDGPN